MEFDLEHQEVTVEASTPFISLIEAIESTAPGRTATVSGQSGQGEGKRQSPIRITTTIIQNEID